MSFGQRFQDALQAIIFIRPADKEVLISKLEKIGIPREKVTWKLFPNSMLSTYIIEVTQLKLQYCINCNHVEESHEVSQSGDRCYGLNKEGNVCSCIKFISTQK